MGATAVTAQREQDRMLAIRRFFLYPSRRYTLGDLAAIWRVPGEAVVAMFWDELDAADRNGADPLTFEVDAASAKYAAEAYYVFRPIEVEAALGEEFEHVRRDHWRTLPLTVHLPRFLAETLAGFPFLPQPTSLASRAERLLCEILVTDRILTT